MNVWVDLINSLSFLPDFVSDPASNYLTTNLHFVYEATVSVPNANRSPQFVNFYNPNLFRFIFGSNISLKLKNTFISAPVRPRAV
jgi:hypothetical protein